MVAREAQCSLRYAEASADTAYPVVQAKPLFTSDLSRVAGPDVGAATDECGNGVGDAGPARTLTVRGTGLAANAHATTTTTLVKAVIDEIINRTRPGELEGALFDGRRSAAQAFGARLIAEAGVSRHVAVDASARTSVVVVTREAIIESAIAHRVVAVTIAVARFLRALTNSWAISVRIADTSWRMKAQVGTLSAIHVAVEIGRAALAVVGPLPANRLPAAVCVGGASIAVLKSTFAHQVAGVARRSLLLDHRQLGFRASRIVEPFFHASLGQTFEADRGTRGTPPGHDCKRPYDKTRANVPTPRG